MKTIKRSADVPYSAAKMFDLVNDIGGYPQFLPWCEWSRVESAGDGFVEASIGVALAGFRKSFRTRNRLERPRSIQIGLVEGPFKRLEGRWIFEDLGSDRSRVTLMLDFEVAPSPLKFAFELLFEEVARQQVAAFARRADALYA